jgi:hypothetical protein
MKKFFSIIFLTTIMNIYGNIEVIEISPNNTDNLPGGKEADGIIGDFVLRNNFIECVISGPAPNRKANMGAFWGPSGVTPGCLYDLCIRGSNNDQLTIFSPSRQRGNISYVKPGDDNQSIITHISKAVSGGLTKRHTYSLEKDAYGLTITSQLLNETKEKISGPITDTWTRFRESGRFEQVEWADSVDPSDKCGYAYTWLMDEQGKTPPKSKTFSQGTEIVVQRYLAVGNSPVQAYGRVMQKVGKVGSLLIKLTDSNRKEISTARLNFEKEGKSIPGYPDEKGVLDLFLPFGEWKVSVIDNGRKTVETNLVISEDKKNERTIVLGIQSGIQFSVSKRDGSPTPCKAQIIGIENTPSPNLGPVDRAYGCKEQYHSENGKFFIGLTPGKYKIIITRGIEHDHFEQIVEVKEGEIQQIFAKLKRTVSTPGWVSTDFHNHSTPSGDNVCGTPDRLINLVAEHIEFAPTTEHNRIMDWTPTIKALGLDKEISTIPGMELTGSGAHLNAFPLNPKHHHQDGGAPKWTKDPRVNALNLMNHSGHHPSGWVHINHPDMIENFIDRNKDGKPDGGYRGILSLIDAIETENYRAAQILHPAPYKISRLAGREQVNIVREFVWLQMLNKGLRTWGIAVSDAHTVHGNGVGGWRTYIPSSTDNPSEIDWKEISRRAKSGQMILTTGPYLEVSTSDGTITGGYARANDSIDLNVRVQCSSWIDIDRIQVLKNGRPDKSLNYTRESNPDLFGDGVLKFDQTLTIDLTEDTHLIVVAYGSNSDLKIGYGSSGQSGIRPCAYNNPIFIDIDGDGFTPNGDILGFSLPTGRVSVSDAKKLLSQAGIPTE